MTTPLPLEGLTSSIADEITELFGARQTRLSAPAGGPQIVYTSGTTTATVTGSGASVALSAPVTGMIDGQVFRVLSDPLSTPVMTLTVSVSVTPGFRHVTVPALTGLAVGQILKPITGALVGQELIVQALISDTEIAVEDPGFSEAAPSFSAEFYASPRRNHARIASVISTTSITLEGAGVGFDVAGALFEISDPGDSTLDVQNVTEWPAAGTVAILGKLYGYSARTDVQLQGLRPISAYTRGCSLLFPVGPGLDHKTLTIRTAWVPDKAGEPMYDGCEFAGRQDQTLGKSALETSRPAVTFEFLVSDTGDSLLSNPEHWPVVIRAFFSPGDVAGAFIQQAVLAGLNVYGVQGGLEGSVLLWNKTVGGTGEFAVETDSAAINTGAGLGIALSPGVDTDLPEGTVVTEWSKTMAALDQLKRALFQRTAEGRDLAVLAANSATNRPALYDSDDEFRRVLRAFAYCMRTSNLALEEVLDGMLGHERWETVELAVLKAGLNEPFTPDAVLDAGRVAVRRRYPDHLFPDGRAYLTGALHAAMSAPTTLTVASPNRLRRVTGVRLAAEPQRPSLDALSDYERGPEAWRLVRFWRDPAPITASSTDGETVLFSSSVTAEFRLGDVFMVRGGPREGQYGTITEITSTTAIKVAGATILSGVQLYRLGGAFLTTTWEVRRPVTNARYYLPTDDDYVEYTTAGAAPTTTIRTAWALASGSQTQNPGLYTESAVADWAHDLIRFEPTYSETIFNALVGIVVPSAAFTGNVLTLTLDEGTGNNLVRFSVDQPIFGPFGTWEARFHDATGAHVAGQTAYPAGTFTFSAGLQILHLELRAGHGFYAGYVNGSIAAAGRFTGGGTGSGPRLVLHYDQNDVLTGTPLITSIALLEMDWDVQQAREHWNRLLATAATVAPNRISATYAFVLGDVGKHVYITRQAQPTTLGSPPYNSARGEWELASTTGELWGIKQYGIQSSVLRPDEIPGEFVWPDSQGHDILVTSGPNAGTYTITALLDDSGAAIDTALPIMLDVARAAMLSGQEVPKIRSTRARISPALPAPETTDPFAIRIMPSWASGKNLTAELVDHGVVTGTGPWTVTIPDALSTGDIAEVQMTTVDQGHLEADIAMEIAAGSGASSGDNGVNVQLPGGTLATVTASSAGTAVVVGHQLQIYDLDGASAGSHVITALPGADVVTVDPPIGVNFTGKTWVITSGPLNIDAGAGRVLEPAYFEDKWCYRADFLDDNLLAAGCRVDFDVLSRPSDLTFPETYGLELLEE